MTTVEGSGKTSKYTFELKIVNYNFITIIHHWFINLFIYFSILGFDRLFCQGSWKAGAYLSTQWETGRVYAGSDYRVITSRQSFTFITMGILIDLTCDGYLCVCICMTCVLLLVCWYPCGSYNRLLADLCIQSVWYGICYLRGIQRGLLGMRKRRYIQTYKICLNRDGRRWS